MDLGMELIKKWYFIVAAIVGAIFTISTVDSDLVKKNYNLVEEWYLSTPSMSGSWSSRTESDNEGSISANEWLENDNQTTMDLNVYDGKFDGIISTPAIRNFIRATPQITDYFLLEGYKHAFRKSGVGYVYEIIMGKKYLFAVVDVKLEGENLVLTDKTEGGSEFIPKEIILLKRSDEAFGERLDAHSSDVVKQKIEQFSKARQRSGE